MMARKRILSKGLLFFLLFFNLLWRSPVYAFEPLTVGVAANFMRTFEELSRLFTEKTSIQVKPTFASTGTLYAQITHGAPYDLFLAADLARPERLHNEGFCWRPFVYARGTLILWTLHTIPEAISGWKKLVAHSSVRRIAIANPETAPYGTAAVASLKETHLWETIQIKLVYAQTVAQVFQFAYTQAADAGFCALSSAYSNQGSQGGYFVVGEGPEIIQAACILKKTTHVGAAGQFAVFLTSDEANKIKRKYGYD